MEGKNDGGKKQTACENNAAATVPKLHLAKNGMGDMLAGPSAKKKPIHDQAKAQQLNSLSTSSSEQENHKTMVKLNETHKCASLDSLASLMSGHFDMDRMPPSHSINSINNFSIMDAGFVTAKDDKSLVRYI